MYTLRQSALFSDEIELAKSNGASEFITINLNITPDLVKEYRKLQLQYMAYQKKAAENPKDVIVMEKAGEVIVGIVTLLFGKEKAEKIIGFYSDDYIQMMINLYPYIENTLVPRLNEIIRQRKHDLKRKFWK